MKKYLLVFIISHLATAGVFAGAIQTNYQGQKQSGMGHTGTGLLLDNSSVFFNPGAVSFLDSLRGFSVGGNFIFARTTYLETFPGNYIANTEHKTATPFTLYAVYKFNKEDNWNLSLGLYNPFENKIQWKDDWKGKFLVRETNFKMLYIQPTLSCKLTANWGFGLGLIYATGNYKLRKAIPVQDTAGVYGEELLKGKASGMGFNAGVYFKPNEKLSIGVDYRSAVNAEIKGNADFTVTPSMAADYQNTKFSTQLNLPGTLSMGIGYKVNAKLKLALDINYTKWKSTDSLIINYAENTSKLIDSHTAQKYENSFTFCVGAQYVLNTKWTLRLGSCYDRSPVKNGYFTPEVPDADKLEITLGTTFNVTKRMHVDASLIYIEGMKRTDTNLQNQFGGSFKTKTVVPGISFEYVF
jgi:long-chain fatty acid transport protein